VSRHPLDDLPDDIRDHLEREIEDNIGRGMSPDEARRAARRAFGSTALATERTRAVWIPVWFDQLRQDLRYASRVLRRSPAASFATLLILALGIGVTGAVYSVVRGVMLRPLPYHEPDRVVSIWETGRNSLMPNVIAPANFVEWRERNGSFDGIGQVGPYRLTFMFDGTAEEVPGFLATANVFSVLGVSATLGRVYTPDEDFGPDANVVLLDYQFWMARFGGRTDVVGTTIVAGGRPRTIAGVLPAGFTVEGVRGNFYVPYNQSPAAMRAAPGRGLSHGLARLRDGVSLEQARAEMTGLAEQLAAERPELNRGRTVLVVPVLEQTVGAVRPALLVLSGAVLLVLLLSCANVASLLLARSTMRARELALRGALGAGRGRLIRQMLTESTLFALLGGSLGLGLAVVLQRALIVLVANRIDVPRLEEVSLDLPVVVFTLGVSLATGFIFGVLPAIVATGGRSEAVRDAGTSRTTPASRRALSSLAAAEVAFSVVLLAGAGLLALSFMRLQHVDPGFATDGLLTARVTLDGALWNDGRVRADFYTRALERVRVLPGVTGAAGISFLPLAGPSIGTSYWRLDRPTPGPGEASSTRVLPVTPRFFDTMNIPIRAGRDFDSRDAIDSPVVAIVSESLVRQSFGGEDPLGRHLHVSIGLPNDGDAEVVGVADDIAFTGLADAAGPVVYVPHTQLAIGLMTLVVRTAGDPLLLAPALRQVVRELDPGVPVADIQTMQGVVDGTLAQSRAITVLLEAFALAALLLAAVGIYGVTAYSVSRRTQEIGVRVALGARPAGIVGMVFRQALGLTVAGIAAGVVAALGLTRLLASLLYDTAPADPFVFTSVVLVLAGTAVAAALVPAWRASRVDPAIALRCE
jgi:putative ABC transport system permease protein